MIPFGRCLLLLAGILVSVPGLYAQGPGDLLPQGRKVSLSEALDSAGLAARLQVLPELPNGRRTVVRLKFTPSGQVDSVVVRPEDGVPPELFPALEEAVRVSVRVQPRDTLVRRAELALRTGRHVSLSEPERRSPVLLNPRAAQQAVNEFGRRNREIFADGPKTVMVRFVLGVDGHTKSAAVVRSSGVQAVDAEALRVAEIFRFDPGKVEGEPVAVLAEVPIVFSLSGR